MNLRHRVKKLEGGNDLKVIVVHERLTDDEKQAAADRHRREHGLPPESVVIVLDEPEASF